MKKVKTLRLASVLLVLVLLTTSIIGGTFAKYATSDSATDSARIAKWGISKPAALNFNLFATNAFDDGKVQSSNDEKVLAPGTSHEQVVSLFTVTGTAPEVKYNYTVELAVNSEASTTIAKLDTLDGFKWTLKAPGATTATEYAKFADLKTAVDGLSEMNIAPNDLPEGYTANSTNTMTIGWAWEFGDSANNVADTAAGDAAAAGSLDTFTLTLTIKAEQVD